jgi:hypothetical protein
MDKKIMVETNFSKELDIKSLADLITKNFYGEADKKKVCRKVFNEFLVTVTTFSVVNLLLLVIEYTEKANQEGITNDERLADFQIELVELWNKVARSKIGIKSFTTMTLDDILKSTPRELFQRCTRGI